MAADIDFVHVKNKTPIILSMYLDYRANAMIAEMTCKKLWLRYHIGVVTVTYEQGH